MADQFNNFFMTKIKDIRENLINNNNDRDPHKFDTLSSAKMKKFPEVSVNEIYKLIMSSPNKQCSSDPLPTWLIKQCAQPLTSYIHKIIHKSITIGEVPEIFKQAIVTPLLKKSTLDQEKSEQFSD